MITYSIHINTDCCLELPKEVYQTNTTRSVEILGMKYADFEHCVVDTIRSFASVKQ